LPERTRRNGSNYTHHSKNSAEAIATLSHRTLIDHLETFPTPTRTINDQPVAIDGNSQRRHYPFMNHDTLNLMMCSMTAAGESWES
jgi:hypothetical protein